MDSVLSGVWEQNRRVKGNRSIRLNQLYTPIPVIPSPAPSPCGDAAAAPPDRKRKEAAAQSAVDIYREIIMDTISYTMITSDLRSCTNRLKPF